MKRASYMKRLSIGDRVFIVLNQLIVFLVFLCVIYPLWYILIMSFDADIYNTSIRLLPSVPSLNGYKAVYEYKWVWSGYLNSILYMVVGTAINLAMTICAAYPLSRKDLRGRGFFMFVFAFTMYFSGGLIPSYLLVSSLKLINTFWVMVVLGAISVYNMIVMRTYFQNSVPGDLREAASIDGCNNMVYLVRILLPLSTPIIAVLGMFYAVGHWNSYMSALIYLNDHERYPLQMILREILVINTMDATAMGDWDPEAASAMMERMEVMRYSLAVIATLPMLILFPFIQKYFVKGMMVGSIKG